MGVETLVTTFSVSLQNSDYTGTFGEAAAVLQSTVTEVVGPANRVTTFHRGVTKAVAAGASAIDFFPSPITVPSGGFISMEFVVQYGATDALTAAGRLLTWTRDSVAVETCDTRGSFCFDTSLTLARVGAETCYITPIYKVIA